MDSLSKIIVGFYYPDEEYIIGDVMNYIKAKLYIIKKIKEFNKIDSTFWDLKEIKQFYTKKEYKFYKKYIHK